MYDWACCCCCWLILDRLLLLLSREEGYIWLYGIIMIMAMERSQFGSDFIGLHLQKEVPCPVYQEMH
jgi:hypothetical protein